MPGRNYTLVVSLIAFLLMGCASSPPKPPAAVGESPASSMRRNAHEMFLANLVAVVAAMGGSNPNPVDPAIRTGAISSNSCSSAKRPQAAPRSNRTEAPGAPTDQTAVSASCQRTAAAQ
jgi:hypothetical protein